MSSLDVCWGKHFYLEPKNTAPYQNGFQGEHYLEAKNKVEPLLLNSRHVRFLKEFTLEPSEP